MSLIASNTGKSFELCPEGVTISRCYRIIDLGTQAVEHKGVKKFKRQILVNWETSNLASEGEHAGKPLMVGKKYTLSLDEKANLRKDLQAWRGRAFTEAELAGFDISALLTKPVMLNIVHSDDKKYANISSMMPLPGGMKAPELANPAVLFSLNDFDQAVFDGLSDGLKAIIQKSPEYAEAVGGYVEPAGKAAGKSGGAAVLDSDDIPF